MRTRSASRSNLEAFTATSHTRPSVAPMIVDVRVWRLGRAPDALRGRLAPAFLASGLLAFAYVLVVRVASGSMEHLVDQARTDWYLLVPIVAGFGVQVALLVELRRRRALHRTGMAAASAGTGASTVGMMACCAHHLADLAPFLGLSAAAPFLSRNRVGFMLVGLVASGIGIAVATRRVRRLGLPEPTREVDQTCEGR